ncbi:MAG TPA: hypothetical protein VM901_07150 [Bdellovibrionota bacterium]|nr:hypothetical protein [Bdellovibrionota bacterium]
MKRNYRSWILGLSLALASVGAHASQEKSYKQLLRDPRAECGFYLARLDSEFTGRKISGTLDPQELPHALKDFDPTQERLVAVGAPPDWMSRRKLKRAVMKSIEDAGFSAAKYTAIRRIGQYVETKVGVFAYVPGQGMRRLASLDEAALERNVSGAEIKAIIDAGGSILISGTPLVGAAREKIEASLKNKLQSKAAEAQVELPPELVRTQSKLRVWTQAFAENPRKAMVDAMYQVRALFPYSEDMVRPTDGEMRSMGQKVTMHTIFSLISFALKRETMQVMIPMTIINGANSAGTGTYRSFIGNWLSRDGDSIAIRTIKGLMMSSFFTFDLYLARNAFDSETLSSMATFAGWSHFFSTSWVSILFQAMWRTPVSAVLNSWERWRSEKDGPEASKWARGVGGSAEKFMTYAMTQFYILSIVMESSFFKLVWNPGHGLGMLGGDAKLDSALGQTLLMNFNVGHLAMATVGAGALVLKNQYRLFDKVVPAVEWLDKLETKVYRGFTGLFKWRKPEGGASP